MTIFRFVPYIRENLVNLLSFLERLNIANLVVNISKFAIAKREVVVLEFKFSKRKINPIINKVKSTCDLRPFKYISGLKKI